MRLIVLFFIAFWANNEVYCQKGSLMRFFCSFNQKAKEVSIDRNIKSSSEAEFALRQILEKSGLPPNIKIYPSSDIDNARATAECTSLNECERVILYNPKFLKKVNKNSHNDWASIMIIAHEVGHHLAGHTTDVKANTGAELKQGELDADEYAGHVLAKMGADLNDAISAVKEFADDDETDTHPSLAKRVEAIKNGWNEEKGIKIEKTRVGRRRRPGLGSSIKTSPEKEVQKSALTKTVLIYNANDVNGSAKRMGNFLKDKVSGFAFEAQTQFAYRSLYSTSKIFFIKPEFESIAIKIEELIPGKQELINYSDKRTHAFFGLENREIVIFVGKDWN